MRTPLAVALLALLVLPCLGQGEPSPGLEAYVGKDLRTLDPNILALRGSSPGANTQGFLQQFDALTGDKTDPADEFGPWWVDRFTSGKAAWMVLEAYPGIDNPDTSAVRVHLFDRHWKRFLKQTFPTGYDRDLGKAQVSRDNLLRQDLLVATTYPNAGSVDSNGMWKAALGLRQYYALLGDQFAPVRLEDHEGGPVRNLYWSRAPDAGPPVRQQTPEEWIGDLGSLGPVRQLAALVWLTGTHLSSTQPRQNNASQESVADSLTFEAVRDAPETSEALSQLRGSPNRWVREYARLGVRPPVE